MSCRVPTIQRPSTILLPTMSLDLLHLQNGGSSGSQTQTEPWSAVYATAQANEPADVESALRSQLLNDQLNAHDLYCPRPDCGVKIIRKSNASWTAESSHPLTTSGPTVALPGPDVSSTLPPPSGYFWEVDSALTFDNVGFSKDVEWSDPGAESSKGQRIKYLTCGACDCGPLGYTILPATMQGGGLAQSVSDQIDAHQFGLPAPRSPARQQFFLAADRVRYPVEQQ